jgi:hypothetical protein
MGSIDFANIYEQLLLTKMLVKLKQGFKGNTTFLQLLSYIVTGQTKDLLHSSMKKSNGVLPSFWAILNKNKSE